MSRKKQRKLKDPFRARERQNYDNPIPSRECIMELLKAEGEPLSKRQLSDALDIHGEEQLEALRRRLKAMIRDGQVIKNRRGNFALVSEMDLLRGAVEAHHDGYGFFIPEDGSPDIFLPAKQMRHIFSGDKVLLRVTPGGRGKKREGVIVEVLESNTHRVSGRLCVERGVAYVMPGSKKVNQDILIAMDESIPAQAGQFVEVEIISEPSRRWQRPLGKITKVLGDAETPGVEIDLAVSSYDIPNDWPQDVEKAAAAVDKTVKNEKRRKDIRHLPLVTIDGEDSRDFDDAVYCERRGEGWRLYVAIADVSHYVKPAQSLDVEAYNRGNSVYFPSTCLPMLPEVLSNDMCSLRPEVDRYCLVCQVDIDAQGELGEFEFFEGIMHSHARLTYTNVYATLQGDVQVPEDLVPHIQELYNLYQILSASRSLRGAIEFDSVETKILFDDQGKIKTIVPYERNEAHQLIEEMMLAANVCAARLLEEHPFPVLFRNHAIPSLDDLKSLREFLKAFGLKLGGAKAPQAIDFRQLLESIKGHREANLIQMVVLRSMQQAVYEPDNVGHFGLAYDGYCHYTSPIRRYPDLIVHRAIKHIIYKQPMNNYPYSHEDMARIGEHCSMTERRADRATREATDWLKCYFIKDHVGEEYDGVVTEVTNFGVFVELKDVYVHGLVHVTALPSDYYTFDRTKRTLQGRSKKNRFKLGDELRILVARVDMESRKIDFDLVRKK